MSISVIQHKSNGIVEIQVMGSFDFSLFNDFRVAYEEYIGQSQHFIVNLESVEYLDSAALGMLLSMKTALGEPVKIEIVGANDFIRNILMISRFDKRFEIR
ncbi:STAS domain-containing protein [Marinomonas ostreistagni]|uniref:STAS domain-containing protein n=1 Tax=Marinomonas ostreistagni TaxID=359209 RepID=UPI0019505A82|nr:STAS domain-containing protein [Marinomonas ostreistagni]MBM6550036.1 STAS domain-containing protein [Marinomonas ostreistagni]